MMCGEGIVQCGGDGGGGGVGGGGVGGCGFVGGGGQEHNHQNQ